MDLNTFSKILGVGASPNGPGEHGGGGGGDKQ